jgi:hypothetical protein
MSAGCGFVPAEPPPVPLRAAAPARRPLVIGEVCPSRVDGMPAMNALFVRQGRTWSADPKEAKGFVARGLVPRFAVLGFSGRKAGMFTTAGTVATRARWPVAAGGYAGALPCADEATVVECQAVYAGCGPAVAVAGIDDTEPIDVPTSAACVVGERLVVDVDGDGTPEVFALEKGRLPDELASRKEAPPPCERRFAAQGAVDLVAVADIDGDGRVEVILQVRGKERMWGVYSATETPQRLQRVAVASPWGVD